jgi:signal recognition particle GTPase
MNFFKQILKFKMVKTYYFDENIAPLTEEETQIMKEYKILARKVDKIYERTDQVIKMHKKTEKENEKKRKYKEEKEKTLYKKQKQQQEQQEEVELLIKNTEYFTQNYNKFKKSFYKLFDEFRLLLGNFENTQNKNDQIQKLRKTFQNKCIHPELFKTIGYYLYEINDGGGSGFGSPTFKKIQCNACILCKHQDDENKKITFSKYIEFDNKSNIKTLFQDINKL